MKYFWLSWYHDRQQGFELHSPWWKSGVRMSDGFDMICAAVIAASEAEAKCIVRDAYDTAPREIEWRFCEPRWELPFNDRFPQETWMEWPN